MFSVLKGYKTPNDEKLFQNIAKDHIYLKPNIFELAKENNKSALYQIGDAYLKLRTKIGYLKALDWYQKSAGAGSAVAQNRIGEMFHHGLGVIKDYHQALEWYFLATETGGSSAAHNNLGTMYYDGKGVGIDHVKALTCFSVAANQGYRDAQFNLAWMYDNENSPVHDKVEAMKWYLKAAEQGHDGAKRRVVQLHRMGIRYRPEYDTNQRPKASPSASKSTTSVRTNTANGTKGANKVIHIHHKTVTATIKKDVSFSPKQVKNMIDENQKHADMVNSKREERQEKTLDINEEKNEIQEQIALLKKEQELLKEKMKIEKELQLQKEKEMELEQKNKEQEILMQALREKMEKERLEREEEKKREQEQVGNKLKMLENMIAEMKGQSSLSLPQLLTQQTLMDEPDEKTSGDTKVQLDALHQDPQKHDIYPLKRTIKRQSKQLVTETDTKTLDHGEKKELVSKGKVAAKEKEKGCENDLYLDDSAEEEETNHTNDLYLDDSTEEEETDHENDLYYDSSEE